MTAPFPANTPRKALTHKDVVKSCKYIETGSYFALEGVRCCVHGTISSPVIITADEIRSNTASYDLVVERRRDLFAAINGLTEAPTGSCLTCGHLKEKKFKDVNFEYLGGEPLPGGMGIQHYSQCNERCTYCPYTQENKFIEPQYDILSYLEHFRKRGKLRGENWIDFSGGEPAMLKNLDEILTYLLSNKLLPGLQRCHRFKHSRYIDPFGIQFENVQPNPRRAPERGYYFPANVPRLLRRVLERHGLAAEEYQVSAERTPQIEQPNG
jgi:hypothetical protein